MNIVYGWKNKRSIVLTFIITGLILSLGLLMMTRGSLDEELCNQSLGCVNDRFSGFIEEHCKGRNDCNFTIEDFIRGAKSTIYLPRAIEADRFRTGVFEQIPQECRGDFPIVDFCGYLHFSTNNNE